MDAPKKCPKCGWIKFCIPENSTFGFMTECLKCKWDWMDKEYHIGDWRAYRNLKEIQWRNK